MKIYKLNKSILSIKNDAKNFLNGLTSNDMEASRNSFLSIHGRIIATFEQVQVSEDEYLISLEKEFEADVMEHLERYAKISGVQIQNNNYNGYFDLDNSCSVEKEDWVIPFLSGKFVVTPREIEVSVSDEEFIVHRVHNNWPLQGIDYKHEFLLNVSETDYVSFTKGCYLGQEPVSKVHSRSKPTNRLVVKNEKDCSEEEKQLMTSKCPHPVTGEICGFVFEKNS